MLPLTFGIIFALQMLTIPRPRRESVCIIQRREREREKTEGERGGDDGQSGEYYLTNLITKLQDELTKGLNRLIGRPWNSSINFQRGYPSLSCS